jgi:mannan polymerase II complex MNN11 subunit
MNPDLSIEADVVGKVDTLMLRNHPVVPPTSVIKTFSHLKAAQVDLIMTQDKYGLAPGSFLVRRGEWGKFFLDTWFDPLYRSYNFQKAEEHALVGLSDPINIKVYGLPNLGTHCAMASDHPIKAGRHPSENHQCI